MMTSTICPIDARQMVAAVEMSPQDALDFQKFLAARHGLRN